MYFAPFWIFKNIISLFLKEEEDLKFDGDSNQPLKHKSFMYWVLQGRIVFAQGTNRPMLCYARAFPLLTVPFRFLHI